MSTQQEKKIPHSNVIIFVHGDLFRTLMIPCVLRAPTDTYLVRVQTNLYLRAYFSYYTYAVHTRVFEFRLFFGFRYWLVNKYLCYQMSDLPEHNRILCSTWRRKGVPGLRTTWIRFLLVVCRTDILKTKKNTRWHVSYVLMLQLKSTNHTWVWDIR